MNSVLNIVNTKFNDIYITGDKISIDQQKVLHKGFWPYISEKQHE